MKKILITISGFCILVTAISTIYSYCNKVKLEGKNIAFLGDSLTYGSLLDENDFDIEKMRWTKILCDNLKANEYNYGMKGNAFGYPDKIAFVDRYKDMYNDADLIIVYGGTNDYYCCVPMGEPNSYDRYDFYGALNILVDGLRNKYPNGKIMFITPNTQNSELSEGNSDVKNKIGFNLDDYCNAIKEVCKEKNVPVMDLNDYLEFDIGHNDKDKVNYSFDGCHYNPEGHKAVAKAVEKFIKKELSYKLNSN